MDKFILDAGFDKVNHEEVKVPLGTWPADKKQKDLGAFMLLTTEHAFEAFGMALFTRTLGMGAPEAKELIAEAKKESRSKKIHSYTIQYVFMKPSWMLELICGKQPLVLHSETPQKE